MPEADQLEWPQGEPLFETNWRAVSEGLIGNGVQDPGDFEVTGTSNNRETQIAAGTAFYQASETSLGSSTTKTHSTGDGSDDRWDILVWDTATSSVVLREGTADPTPEPPDIQGDEILLALVYVPQNFDAPFSDTDHIFNWRGFYSNEAEHVHFDDATGDYGVSNVEAALDAIDLDFTRGRDNQITGQFASLGTNPGSFGALVDAVVDSNSAQGTSHSYTFAIDSSTLLQFYAESDGSGGLQNVRLDVEQLLSVGDDVVTTGGTTIWDSTAGEVPQGQLGGPASSLSGYPLTIGTDVAAHLDGGDLLAASGGLTVYDSADDHVPRPRVDDVISVTTEVADGTNTSSTTSDEEAVLIDTATNSQSFTLTLASADAVEGNRIRVADIGGAGKANPITIDTEGSETIDGESSTTIDTDFNALILMSDGTDWYIISSLTSAGRGPPQEDFSGAETGTISGNNEGVLVVTSLDDQETVEVYRATLTTDTVEAIPSGVDLLLVTFDNSGGFTSHNTIISGDGSTIHDDETGSPLASHTNTSGSPQSTGVIVNETTGNAQDVVAMVEGRTGL